MPLKIAVLPGDGIGPEVVSEAVKVIRACMPDAVCEEALIGGAAYDDCGTPLPESTLQLCKDSGAVLLGAVGGPKWDHVDPRLRPEVGALLPLRGELNLYANVRPAKTFPALLAASPLKGERGLVDMVVVRELTGGIYFGQPRERKNDGNTAIDTCVYHRHEVERITLQAIAIARTRKHEIVSVDKANVLETSRLWREVVAEIGAKNPDIQITNMLVDNCAMQLVRDPQQFDVILTENMFGDILSDESAMITGSLGLLPSASLSDPKDGRLFGLYEPIHGSAPDIAGQNKANPIATVLSVAMMFQYTFGESEIALRIESAVSKTLDQGFRTADIFTSDTRLCSTSEMGDAIVRNLQGSA